MPRRKTVAEYDEEIRQLRERQRDARARERTAERKAENHAKFVAGGILLGIFPDGWRSVDWETLAKIVRADRNAAAFARARTDVLSTDEATRRLREWERADRKARESR